MALASTLVVALHYAEDFVFFKEIKDYALDIIMYWHSDFEPKLANGQPMQRMALFEIDDQTYREWGSPVLTPRDKLKALIEAAEKGGANVIAVDIGLSWAQDGCIHQAEKTPACPTASPEAKAADESLAKYLQAINESQAANAPVIILTRTYRLPLENGVVNQKHFLTRQPSFLDNYITEEKNVFWSSTFFVVDADRVRRRWQLASLVCQDNHLTVVPSMQLLVALAQLYATDDSTREAAQVIQQFKNRLNHWASTLPCDASQGTTIPRLCQQQACPPLIVELPTKAGISDKLHQVDLAGGRETERVVYRFAPPDTLDPNRLSFIIKKSARHVLAAGADVYQRIVLIGGTHQDTRDNHPVPIRIKDVDGIYIVANAIDT
ncbi:CHASE2 domain protein, partial [Candidatus Thiomargarita nelsonii]